MKNNIQKETNSSLKQLTLEQLLSVKGGTGTETTTTTIVIDDIML